MPFSTLALFNCHLLSSRLVAPGTLSALQGRDILHLGHAKVEVSLDGQPPGALDRLKLPQREVIPFQLEAVYQAEESIPAVKFHGIPGSTPPGLEEFDNTDLLIWRGFLRLIELGQLRSNLFGEQLHVFTSFLGTVTP